MKLTTKYLLALITTVLLLNLSVAEAVITGRVEAVPRNGEKGDPGATGATGPAGIAGQRGAAGMAGQRGAVGAVGPQGPAGAAGTNGSSFSYSMTCGVSGTDACKIGAVGPGGGWIFFVDFNDEYTFNYLEVAPTEALSGTWCNTPALDIPSLALSSARALGAGQQNTAAMIQAGCTSGAANKAEAYTTLTKSDWFLGSLAEMQIMYTNLTTAGASDGFLDIDHKLWTSTPTSVTSYTWATWNFYNGLPFATSTNVTNYYTLPIRAF